MNAIYILLALSNMISSYAAVEWFIFVFSADFITMCIKFVIFLIKVEMCGHFYLHDGLCILQVEMFYFSHMIDIYFPTINKYIVYLK